MRCRIAPLEGISYFPIHFQLLCRNVNLGEGCVKIHKGEMAMYGLDELKTKLNVTESQVSCPVRDCQRQVERQRKVFRREDRFFCSDHRIYISPSTFEYEKEGENILSDFPLLRTHMTSKRESRIARDNSEDAVTWNVFRFLERQDLLLPYLSGMSDTPLREAKSIYWSHDLETSRPWNPLWEARQVFEGDPSKGSEPDLIVLTDRILFFIEAKLTASNKTVPSHSNYPKQYISGGDGWWNNAFAPGADYGQIAEGAMKYELMRFWLLGTWMAKQLDLDFMLINLVRDASEKDIEARFRKYLRVETAKRFKRSSWEEIYWFIRANAREGSEKDKIIHYFNYKAVGYQHVGEDWQIRKAFSI
jgi:hypothetical protein